eukprot:scaffold45037_cov19-Tisochrysis_lutea.AAC.3
MSHCLCWTLRSSKRASTCRWAGRVDLSVFHSLLAAAHFADSPCGATWLVSRNGSQAAFGAEDQESTCAVPRHKFGCPLFATVDRTHSLSVQVPANKSSPTLAVAQRRLPCHWSVLTPAIDLSWLAKPHSWG